VNTKNRSAVTQSNKSYSGQAPGKKKSFFHKVMLVLNVIFILLLLLSYLSSYIDPSFLWTMAFLGLVYPIILCINLAFIVYWILAADTFVFIPLIAVAIGFNHITNIIQVDLTKEKYAVGKDIETNKPLGSPLKVMSYNVRLFDLYNWTKNKESREKIFKLLRSESNDIACFQEFFNEDKGEFKNIEAIMKIQNACDYHVSYSNTLRVTEHWGIATFSRYPIVKKGVLEFPNGTNNSCIFSDIKINEDTIRVYNAHLESVHLHKEDYQYIESLNNEKDEDDDLEGAHKIISRLKKAFVIRSKQTDLLSVHMQNCPYPIVLCGDFNDTPSSFTYHKLSQNLTDAFVESGNGLGSTYYGIFPSFRIDYIFHDKGFTSDDFRIIHKKLSDHYPITCWLNILKKNK
jgi:endonuclease/exonuclease/phosphatase family metal-dependent hydrolase